MNRIEIFMLIQDFFRLKTIKEKIFYFGMPILVGLIYVLSWNINIIKPNFSADVFMNDFLNSIITVIALFISFSLAYMTIMMTSDSENIKEVKEKTSKYFEINKKPVFLFQILMADITYTILIQVILLCFAFLQKFLILISTVNAYKIYLLIDIILLTHIIILLLRNVKNVYFTFWQSK